MASKRTPLHQMSLREFTEIFPSYSEYTHYAAVREAIRLRLDIYLGWDKDYPDLKLYAATLDRMRKRRKSQTASERKVKGKQRKVRPFIHRK